MVPVLNVDKKPDIKRLKKMLLPVKELKERNKQIVKAYAQVKGVKSLLFTECYNTPWLEI